MVFVRLFRLSTSRGSAARSQDSTTHTLTDSESTKSLIIFSVPQKQEGVEQACESQIAQPNQIEWVIALALETLFLRRKTSSAEVLNINTYATSDFHPPCTERHRAALRPHAAKKEPHRSTAGTPQV